MKTILLLEDDESLNKGISLKLKKEGYHVLSAYGVSEAEIFFAQQTIDLIISDITMADGNGMDFCRHVREKSKVLIIFLTSLDQEIDIVNGYDAGADDYIVKPFSLIVLISKVNAFMRRIQPKDTQLLTCADITVSYKEMKALQNGEPLFLSKKELQILVFLMEHAKQIVSREQILEAIWDVDGQFVNENTVAVNISRLRTKLEKDASSPEYIKNVRGLGLS